MVSPFQSTTVQGEALQYTAVLGEALQYITVLGEALQSTMVLGEAIHFRTRRLLVLRYNCVAVQDLVL
jgi:hypothetical protein